MNAWVLIIVIVNHNLGSAATSVPFQTEEACNGANAHLAAELKTLPGVGFTLQCHPTIGKLKP